MNYCIFYYVVKWPQWFINNVTLSLVSCSCHYCKDWLAAPASPPPLDDPLRKFNSSSSSRWKNLLLLLLFFCHMSVRAILTCQLKLTIQGGSCTEAIYDPECSWRGRPLWGWPRSWTTAGGDRGSAEGLTRCWYIPLTIHPPASLVPAFLERQRQLLEGFMALSLCSQLARHLSREQNKIKRKERQAQGSCRDHSNFVGEGPSGAVRKLEANYNSVL